MAVTYIRRHGVPDLPDEIQCLSSDVMPDAQEGSTVHIVDTGEEYVRYDGGWEPDRRRVRAIYDAAMM